MINFKTLIKIPEKSSKKMHKFESVIYVMQCLWNYVSTSAFADVSYSMADVEAKFYV